MQVRIDCTVGEESHLAEPLRLTETGIGNRNGDRLLIIMNRTGRDVFDDRPETGVSQLYGKCFVGFDFKIID